MNHLEEIRAKISIEELVGGYVQLKKAGRNLKGLCPFHNDSRPSLMVSPEKGIAYCFSCNSGGDAFKFIQLVEKVEFPEAVRILAERTGVPLPEFKPGVQDQRRRILAMNQAAADFYADQLRSYAQGMQYFLGRGLKDENALRHFGLGYAPDSFQALKQHLASKGYGEKEMLEAGLLNQRSLADSHTYDRFRHRYMFPILDHQGNAVGFGGRIIGEGEPKYLNSPDTPVYNKSHVLYGLNWAKEAIKKQDLAIVMEGYMDVIAAQQAGTLNAVATSGTALTEQQLKLLGRYTRNIAFAFDQDHAGWEATRRAIDLAQAQQLNISVIAVPDGKDPDECIRNAPEKWAQAVARRQPVMEFYFSYALEKNDLATPEGQRAITELLFPLIRPLSVREQGEYLKRLAFLLKTEPKYLWDDFRRVSAPRSFHPASASAEKRKFSREEYLLGFVFQYPELYPLLNENLWHNFHFDPETEIVYKACQNVYNRTSCLRADLVKKEMEPPLQEKIDLYSMLIEEEYPDFSLENAKKEVVSLIVSINEHSLRRAEKGYRIKIQSAAGREEKNLLLAEHQRLVELKRKLSVQ